ncbi:unnamed protein product [marine sediment metagenome]|uniref:Uncharacterized protein n=1 Tax=marine sediment metagenome TaxID=412755 RepID=X0UU08_9ZZZZ
MRLRAAIGADGGNLFRETALFMLHPTRNSGMGPRGGEGAGAAGRRKSEKPEFRAVRIGEARQGEATVRLGHYVPVALCVAMVMAGCAVNEAVLTGHDFIDEAADALQVGIDEYHADDGERLAVARRHLVAAFVKDVVAASSDGAKVEAKTQQFLSLLEKAEQAAAVERQRRARLAAWLDELRQVNADMRETAEWKLGWNERIRTYVGQLRESAHGDRSGKQSD